MKIKKFRVTNYGRFSELDVPLAPTNEVRSNVTIFIGNNGAGKTSLLDAIATSLSWYIARLVAKDGRGQFIPERLIKNDCRIAEIDIAIEDDQGRSTNPDGDSSEALYHWSLVKARKGARTRRFASYTDVNRLVDYYVEGLERNESFSLPLLAFYQVERVVVEIPMRIKGKHQFRQIDGYENALGKGVEFRRFFEWFREREDAENESGISEEIFEQLTTLFDADEVVWKKLRELKASSRDRQLTAVRTAIQAFIPEFANLRIKRKPRLHMSVEKNGEVLDVAQLSQGEKSMLALVGDIARRMAMMNPKLENPLHGEGIVLIDEVDLHLHPKWQKTLVNRLRNTFPNCQFILTTHSPLVVSDAKDVLVYSLDDGELNQIRDLYGLDANSALATGMGVVPINEHVDNSVRSILMAIQNGQIDEAKEKLKQLQEELPQGHIEVTKANLLLQKLELRHAKNNERG